jgi:cytoskeletal protein CcmA (bactofilin family)
MSTIGKGIVVTGTIEAEESVSIAGNVKGEILATGHDVTLEPGGRIDGNATARTMNLKGTFVGRIIALESVRIHKTAWVKAEIAAPSIAIDDGAVFNGTVEPARIEAALRVAAYRRKA